MRADRLVAILLMLQRRGQVTAAEVAEELEVSERTARRDLDSLAMAGVPVYSVRGRGGGWRLAGGGRIDLSGLSADEARALFLVAGPSADVTPEVRSALRKLVRAMPEALRGSAEAAAGAVAVDPTTWDGTGTPRWRPPLLDAVESAVVDRECVRLTYEGRARATSEREVHPLGVATKGRNWYLVADTDDGLRTFRVDRMVAVERTGRPAVRPEGFELTEAWAAIVERVDEMRTPLRVRATASSEAARHLRFSFGNRVRIDGDPATGDRVTVEIRGHSVRSMASELAGFGAWVVVEEPVELRAALAGIGDELRRTYGD